MSSGVTQSANFYPRPPRGGRLARHLVFYANLGFLSTPSARRATIFAVAAVERLCISIHALREEGDRRTIWSVPSKQISIHALREEGDIRCVFQNR